MVDSWSTSGYRPVAEICGTLGGKISTSTFAVHAPATALPMTSKMTALANEPGLATSASAKKELHARPAPRLQAFTLIQRLQLCV
jgi:hypothetical protein